MTRACFILLIRSIKQYFASIFVSELATRLAKFCHTSEVHSSVILACWEHGKTEVNEDPHHGDGTSNVISILFMDALWFFTFSSVCIQ